MQNTLSYAQLQRICAKNKPRGVKCAGKGVTKAYLHEKLSALGLLDNSEAPASATSRAPNTAEYLLSLSQDVRAKIIKTYPALAGEDLSSTNAKRAMTEVAGVFANTPAWKITVLH